MARVLTPFGEGITEKIDVGQRTIRTEEVVIAALKGLLRATGIAAAFVPSEILQAVARTRKGVRQGTVVGIY